MLTTLPLSRCILIGTVFCVINVHFLKSVSYGQTSFKFKVRICPPGVANAIDLADRFLPKLKSLNCKNFSITVWCHLNTLLSSPYVPKL
jgi:cell division control protein 6